MLNYQVNGARMKFLVRGKKGHWHRITFVQNSGQLFGSCACPAGMRGEFCSHRYRLLKGRMSYLLSDNTDDVERLMGLIEGTEIEAAMTALKAAEKMHKKSKEGRRAARARFAKAIRPPANDYKRKAG